jgi:hypothetical protein
MAVSTLLKLCPFAVLAVVSAVPPANAEPVDLELVLAIDVSGSVDYEEGQLQRDGYVQAFRDQRVIDAVQSGFHGRIAVTYLEWADMSARQVVVDWQLVSDPDSAARLADLISTAPRTRGRYTSISGAIEMAAARFADNGYESRRLVIDISGDGPNNIGGLVTAFRDRAVTAGITINGLPIINDRAGPFGQPPMRDLDEYYRNCVIGGPWAFIVVAEGFKSFAEAVRRKLLIEIGGGPPEPEALRRADGGGHAEPTRPLLASALGWAVEPAPLPALPLLHAATEGGPPCDIGERQLGIGGTQR